MIVKKKKHRANLHSLITVVFPHLAPCYPSSPVRIISATQLDTLAKFFYFNSEWPNTHLIDAQSKN